MKSATRVWTNYKLRRYADKMRRIAYLDDMFQPAEWMDLAELLEGLIDDSPHQGTFKEGTNEIPT
jgi:hypothetical protein